MTRRCGEYLFQPPPLTLGLEPRIFRVSDAQTSSQLRVVSLIRKNILASGHRAITLTHSYLALHLYPSSTLLGIMSTPSTPPFPEQLGKPVCVLYVKCRPLLTTSQLRVICRKCCHVHPRSYQSRRGTCKS